MESIKKMSLSAVEDKLNMYEMEKTIAGGCYGCQIGMAGSAILGGLAGLAFGPIGGCWGYWAGAAVGYASFC
jgi:hypothetical protein